MAKKIGILTIQKSIDSIGACLQTYGLWKFISDFNDLNVDVIDLMRPVFIEYKSPKIKNFYRNEFISKKKLSSIFKQGIKYCIRNEYRKFNKKITYSRKYTIDSLYLHPPRYDLFISGSDQIWNPYQPYFIEPYFCTFTDKKKISYASSIGTDEIDEEVIGLIKYWLSDYDYISVREERAKNILSKYTEQEITVLIDPTFLIKKDEWRKIGKKVKINNKFIFCFSVSIDYEFEKTCNKMFPNDNLFFFKKNKGPMDFLGFIEKADMVITDSFHGTAMSIIFNKKFFVIKNNNNSKKFERIRELLILFDLEKRYLVSLENLNEEKINYSKINKKISDMQEKAMVYLSNAIGSVEGI